ncbi:hypothetical protein AX17_005082, partial [Amanita inopinata Kibby_2008]
QAAKQRPIKRRGTATSLSTVAEQDQDIENQKAATSEGDLNDYIEQGTETDYLEQSEVTDVPESSDFFDGGGQYDDSNAADDEEAENDKQESRSCEV